ncbi:MAG: hypothetical protein K2W95_12340 [Candidatus Obscuribacterales bacterium]|nr:hypothetical protein [Candidatus Obscuribacterales bacterium]
MLDTGYDAFDSGSSAATYDSDLARLYDGFEPEMPAAQTSAPKVEKTEKAEAPTLSAVATEAAPSGVNEALSGRMDDLRAKFDSFIAKASTPIFGAEHTSRLTRMSNGDELTEAGMLLFG